jgi:hypothetical protein
VIVTGGTAAEAKERARQARNAVSFVYEAPHPATESFLTGTGSEPWWFAQARGLPDSDASGWLRRSQSEDWRDFYGNSLADLVAILAREGLRPLERPSRFWRALVVGGLSGARYAAEAW